MEGIIETRTLKISDKIIKPDDIRKLFSDIETEIDKLKIDTDKNIEQLLKPKKESLSEEEYQKEINRKTQRRILSITLIANDSSEYQSQSLELLSLGGIVDTKQINQIRFYYDDYNYDISIRINLRHTEYDDWNEIEIKGRESIWVNGLMRKLEDNINSWEKQKTFVKRYKWLLNIILILFIGFVFERILEFVIQFIPPEGVEYYTSGKKISKEAGRVLMYIMMCSTALYPALSLGDRIKELWLSVELHTGQEYNLIEKQRRLKLWTFITLIVVPTIISILTSI